MVQSAETFAHRLRALRERVGMTKYMLAKRTGLNKQTLLNLESGKSIPSWETVQKLALALGVSCQEFVDAAVTIPPADTTAPGKPGRPRKQRTPATAGRARGRKGKGR